MTNTMSKSKRKRLEALGWRLDNTDGFLGPGCVVLDYKKDGRVVGFYENNSENKVTGRSNLDVLEKLGVPYLPYPTISFVEE